MNTCVWCGRSSTPLVEISVPSTSVGPGKEWNTIEVTVHPEHADTTRRYFAYYVRFKTVFHVGVVVLWLLIAIGLVFFVKSDAPGAGLVLGVPLVAASVFMWWFPFATAITVGGFGIRRSIQLVRFCAVIIGVGAVVILVSAGVTT